MSIPTNEVPVHSTNIRSIAWGDNVLRVRFLSGGDYVYMGVRKATYNHLLAAPSKGTYFHRKIRNHYVWRKI